MSYTRSSLAAAEREASERTCAAQRSGSKYRYHAQRYPEGTSDASQWRWGVARVEIDYGPNRENRFGGFVWREET